MIGAVHLIGGGVIQAIENHFDGYLDYESMFQDRKNRNCYKNRYNITFVHDFDAFKSLRTQIEEVRIKYERRILRFYEIITKPTLFVRYIYAEEKVEDIENLHDRIVKILKKYNELNEIIYVTDKEKESDKIQLFFVERDIDDIVARKFLKKNKELHSLIYSIPNSRRYFNLKRYYRNQNVVKKNVRKIKRKLKNKFMRVYEHDRCF